jgi:hypothetical protein
MPIRVLIRVQCKRRSEPKEAAMPRLALAVILVAVVAAPARAQVPVGPAFQVNTYVTQYQFFSSVGIDPNGGFDVVWSSNPQDGSNNGVYGQRYSSAGARIGGEFQVNTYTPGSQGGPDSAVLADGGLVVVFTNEQPPSIFARRYDRGGSPRGPDFRVDTTAAAGTVPVVAADPRGGFIVVWGASDGSGLGIHARRYDRAGEAAGGQFQVNTYTTGVQSVPAVAATDSGAFGIFWTSVGQDGSGQGVFGQRFDGVGAPVGAEFRVNSYTTADQGFATVAYDRLGNATVASDENGNFVVAWFNQVGYFEVHARRYDAQGIPRGGPFVIAPSTFEDQLDHALASDRRGNFIVSWTAIPQFDVFARRFGWLFPYQLAVDTSSGPNSDGNRILEACETVAVETTWRNLSGAVQTLSGSASAFNGPPGATYVVTDATATYGSVANGGLGACRNNSDCFAVSIPCPPSRPVVHWDPTLVENIAPVAQGQSAAWRLHVGESFTDVPRTSAYYIVVEAMLHNGVTGGCTATQYCPGASTTREQMAVFAVSGREGPAYAPPACGTPMFADVPASSPFCRWIEELARRGVVTGCGGGNYCPASTVTREEMAVFAVRTADPTYTPPACTTPLFNDVPASSPYCRWIEELVRRGVVTGCGGGNCCPTVPVTREQMAVFIVFTFGLGLYTA